MCSLIQVKPSCLPLLTGATVHCKYIVGGPMENPPSVIDLPLQGASNTAALQAAVNLHSLCLF